MKKSFLRPATAQLARLLSPPHCNNNDSLRPGFALRLKASDKDHANQIGSGGNTML